MTKNPRITQFFDLGIKRFADRGIDGIKVDEICKEVGVAKTSFYHYFGNKKGFIEQLFDYWYDQTTGEVYNQIKHIDNAIDRFLALKERIDANEEIEYFYLQMKLFALSNTKAKQVAEKARKKRFDVLFEIFKMHGQSNEEATLNTRKMILMYFGRVALTHGYTGSTQDIDITTEEFLLFLGLKTN
jgi:AcrR family transcriptional regulator